jgi:hypothetical protein
VSRVSDDVIETLVLLKTAQTPVPQAKMPAFSIFGQAVNQNDAVLIRVAIVPAGVDGEVLTVSEYGEVAAIRVTMRQASVAHP